MNKKYNIILLIAIIFVIQINPVYAVKQAIFPNEQSLQPIPTYVHPNISGNINSSALKNTTNTTGNTDQVNTTDNQVTPIQANNSNISPWFYIIVVIIVGTLFFVYLRLRKK